MEVACKLNELFYLKNIFSSTTLVEFICLICNQAQFDYDDSFQFVVNFFYSIQTNKCINLYKRIISLNKIPMKLQENCKKKQ